MKILFVGYRDPNHSAAGGYDPIAAMPGADYLEGTGIIRKYPKSVTGRLRKRLALMWLYIRARLRRPHYDVVHCFYADTCLFPFRRSNKHKLVVTTHLDIKDRQRFPAKFIQLLRKANAVVVLSSYQANQLKNEYGIQAHFIPHGFNIPKFEHRMPESAADFDSSKINLFVSGQQYRDIETVFEAVKYCHEHLPNIHFHLVGSKQELKDNVKGFNNATIYPRIYNDEYYTLMSQCDYNFLPVLFATANNTLLEGQALGLRGIFPLLPGISDYAAPEPLNIFYKDREHLFSILSLLQKSPLSSELKHFFKRFEWKNIYPKLQDLYNSI